jgi:hypothetical protein
MAMLEIDGQHYKISAVAEQMLELIAQHEAQVNGIDWGEIEMGVRPQQITLQVNRSMVRAREAITDKR